jgi:membrane protein required for colicin V production
MGSYLDTSLPVLDIVVAFLLCWGGYKGFQKGFFAEILAIFILLFALFFGLWMLTTGLGELSARTGASVPKVVAFLLYFLFYCLVVGAVHWIGKKAQGMVGEIFEGFDNFMGLVFGVLKYSVMLGFVLQLLITAGVLNERALLATSHTYIVVQKINGFVLTVASALVPSMQDILFRFKELFNQAIS